MEPVLDVSGKGVIWYSATCCIGRAPPIWISTDGGESLAAIPFADGTGIIRDGTGIEGDFAIDDASNVYFFDILAATAYFTKFDEDGNHIHTKPDSFEPLLDRPWVRAGAEEEVFLFYNTGGSTNFVRSTTGGWVWDYAGITSFPCPLMTMGQVGMKSRGRRPVMRAR